MDEIRVLDGAGPWSLDWAFDRADKSIMRFEVRTKTLQQKIVLAAAGLGASLLLSTLTACSPPTATALPSSEAKVETGPDTGYRHSALNVNMYPSEKLVCEPLGGSPDSRVNGGLSAELFYIPKKILRPAVKLTSVDQILEQGVKADRRVFLSQLDVRTQSFKRGFVTDLGEALRDDDEKALTGNFALKMSTVLSLADDQEEGLYELAILSSDGAVLSLREEDGNYRVNVDNDGEHETRLACGSNAIELRHGTERIAEVKYFKGSRANVAMILLMRPVSESDSAQDPACGQTGDDVWFDVKNASKPKAAYQDLLARGWRPLSKKNYSLPQEAIFNPCKDGMMATITDFEIVAIDDSRVEVRWETNIPATSQVILTHVASDRKSITPSDNQLRKKHAVVIEGLEASTEYALQAMAITETYGKSMTTHLRATTRP